MVSFSACESFFVILLYTDLKHVNAYSVMEVRSAVHKWGKIWLLLNVAERCHQQFYSCFLKWNQVPSWHDSWTNYFCSFNGIQSPLTSLNFSQRLTFFPFCYMSPIPSIVFVMSKLVCELTQSCSSIASNNTNPWVIWGSSLLLDMAEES